jgi:hypothetical protein
MVRVTAGMVHVTAGMVQCNQSDTRECVQPYAMMLDLKHEGLLNLREFFVEVRLYKLNPVDPCWGEPPHVHRSCQYTGVELNKNAQA